MDVGNSQRTLPAKSISLTKSSLEIVQGEAALTLQPALLGKAGLQCVMEHRKNIEMVDVLNWVVQLHEQHTN